MKNEVKAKIAIVIVAFDRPVEVTNLYNSIECSVIPDKTDLVVSIDFGPKQDIIYNFFKNINWIYGEKIIIKRDINLGLKKHVLCCGDISKNYDFIIFLEEDLLVSKFFMDYSVLAVNNYGTTDDIACISLYSYRVKESDKMLFFPIQDGNDTYFMQFCPSWGQIWTNKQWSFFKTWFLENQEEMFTDNKVPEYIRSWPISSWKKHFIRYMISTNKYTVFPRLSLSTNTGSDGQHHNKIHNLFETQLLEGNKSWVFPSLKNASLKYNAEFKLVPPYPINKFSERLVFDQNLSNRKEDYFFKLFPFRSTFYFKVFIASILNDFSIILKKTIKYLN